MLGEVASKLVLGIEGLAYTTVFATSDPEHLAGYVQIEENELEPPVVESALKILEHILLGDVVVA